MPPEAAAAEVVKRPPKEEVEAPQQIVRIPRQIPTSLLTSEREADLISYLDYELNQAEDERSDFIKKLARWKVAYRAPMQTEPKHFPIFNSSNVVMPVIKEAVNTIAAQLVQATMTARPRWVLKDLASEWEPFIDGVENFLDIASDRDMKLPSQVIPWIIETAKLGTGIMQMGYEVDEVRTYRYTSNGEKVYPKTITRKDGPAPKHIPLSRFWIRFHETDIQMAEWCGVELDYSEFALQREVRLGKFKKVSVDEIIKAGNKEHSDPEKDAQDDIEETKPLRGNVFRVHRVNISYDIDGDGIPEELVIYYERSCRKILGAFFNPLDSGKKPYVKIGYFPVENRFYDEGLCEMLEQIQAAVSSMVNKRSDNATLANLKMIIKKKIVQGLKPGDPLYSGKIIETQDPFRDIREFSLSDIYPSTITEETIMQKRGERLAGMNEGTSGAAMPVSRTTASAQLALLQEQAKRIDLTIRSIRDGLDEIGVFGLEMYFQYGTLGKAVAWLGSKGKLVEAIFTLPRALLELGYGIRTQTPTSLQNQQVRRENKIALFNLLVQAHKELIPFAQAFAPDELPVLAQSMVAASRKYLEDVLETFEETDPESVLAGLSVLERILPRPEDMGGLEAITRADSSTAILESISRLESSLREAQDFGNGGRGVSSERRNDGRLPPAEGLQGRDLTSLGLLPDSIFSQREGR